MFASCEHFNPILLLIFWHRPPPQLETFPPASHSEQRHTSLIHLFRSSLPDVTRTCLTSSSLSIPPPVSPPPPPPPHPCLSSSNLYRQELTSQRPLCVFLSPSLGLLWLQDHSSSCQRHRTRTSTPELPGERRHKQAHTRGYVHLSDCSAGPKLRGAVRS